MERLLKKIVLSEVVALSILSISSEACTRVMCVEGDRVITSRSMDWKKNFPTNLWIFPRGMDRIGDLGKDPIKWTSEYGSVVAVGYNAVTVDGMNEKGLVVNELWETEANYGESNNSTISVGAFAQYVLDNYKNVNEAVKGLEHLSFQITSASLPDNKIKIPKGTIIPFTHRTLPINITINLPTSMHLAISDSTGDSAIVEFIKGKMVIHHSSKYKVMTNSPTFDKQLAINEYWQDIGGNAMLPGTHRPADRFVRASFYTENPITGNKGKVYIENEKMAIAKAFSIIREASVPLGVSIPLVNLPEILDKHKPLNIVPASSTIWRTIADQKSLRYYFDSAVTPSVFWIDINKLDLSENGKVKKLDLTDYPNYSGEVSDKFEDSEPFEWLH